MRSLVLVFAFAGLAFGPSVFGQAMVEFGAAAAGGAAGGAAGKGVSDGINKIFGKVDAQTKQAAKGASKQQSVPVPPAPAPAASSPSPAPTTSPTTEEGAASGTATATAKPRSARKAASNEEVIPEPPVDTTVPPPPAMRRAPVVVAKAKAPRPVVEHVPAMASLPPLPPPHMTLEDLKALTVGTRREELLRFGAPASRVTMVDSGHLLETYHYASKDASLGIVRLNDGAISGIEVH